MTLMRDVGNKRLEPGKPPPAIAEASAQQALLAEALEACKANDVAALEKIAEKFAAYSGRGPMGLGDFYRACAIEAAKHNAEDITQHIHDSFGERDFKAEICLLSFIHGCRHGSVDVAEFGYHNGKLSHDIVAWGAYRAQSQSEILEWLQPIIEANGDYKAAQERQNNFLKHARENDTESLKPEIEHFGEEAPYVLHESALVAIEAGQREAASLLTNSMHPTHLATFAFHAGHVGQVDVAGDIIDRAADIRQQTRLHTMTDFSYLDNMAENSVRGAAAAGKLEALKQIIAAHDNHSSDSLWREAALSAAAYDQSDIIEYALGLETIVNDKNFLVDLMKEAVENNSAKASTFLLERKGGDCVDYKLLVSAIRNDNKAFFDSMMKANPRASEIGRALSEVTYYTNTTNGNIKADYIAALYKNSPEHARASASFSLAYHDRMDVFELVHVEGSFMARAEIDKALQGSVSAAKERCFAFSLPLASDEEKANSFEAIAHGKPYSPNGNAAKFITRLLDSGAVSADTIYYGAVTIALRECEIQGETAKKERPTFAVDIINHSSFPVARLNEFLCEIVDHKNKKAIAAAVARGGNKSIVDLFNAAVAGDASNIASLVSQIVEDEAIQKAANTALSGEENSTLLQAFIECSASRLKIDDMASTAISMRQTKNLSVIIEIAQTRINSSHFNSIISAKRGYRDALNLEKEVIDILLSSPDGKTSAQEYLAEHASDPDEPDDGLEDWQKNERARLRYLREHALAI